MTDERIGVTKPAALILMDVIEDGVCEERGWVETTVTEDEARDRLAEFCCDEDGKSPYRPDCGPAKKVWLAPDAHAPWRSAEPGSEGAIEFWEVPVV